MSSRDKGVQMFKLWTDSDESYYSTSKYESSLDEKSDLYGNGGIEFVSQYLYKILINNEFGLGSIDYADVALSSLFKGSGALLTQSFLDFKG